MLPLKQGDIILFKGQGLFSRLIMAAPGASFSHVGMYVRFGRHSCLFESTSLGILQDIITDQRINGVQLVPFEQRVNTYEGEVFHRPILGPRTATQHRLLEEFINLHYAKPYEKSMRELANAELDLPLPWELNKEDDSSLFCSETAAYALRAMGLMENTTKPANEFTPSDFAGDIALKPGYSFGELKVL